MRERTYRVGAHVDGVNGYTNCRLAMGPDSVSIRLAGWLPRLFGSRAVGRTVEHQGVGITLALVRYQTRWRRAAILLFDDQHQVVLPMTRKKAGRIVEALRADGHEVREIALGPFDGPDGLVALEQYRYKVSRRGRSA